MSDVQTSAAGATSSASAASTAIAGSSALRPESFDLWGSRLIEASAGTGKTWTIAALYLRLVLGHGGRHGFERPLRPAEILVMTFTRAATRELSDRIRERLLVAAQWFRGQQPADASDPFLESLLADYPLGQARNQAAWWLSLAAEGMDEAAVLTIDAWCQRMLREHAFDSGCLFDEELVADEEALQLEAAQDYWRQSCYPLAPEQLTQVLDVWRNVEALAKDMKDLLAQGIGPEAGAGALEQVLRQCVAERKRAVDQIKSGWAQRAANMQGWLDAQLATRDHGWDGRKLSPRHYTNWLERLRDWADGRLEADIPPLSETAWERLTPDGLLMARKADAPPMVVPLEFSAFAQLRSALDKLVTVKEALRRHAAARIAQRLLQLKRQSGSFGFADMLTRLNTALASDSGARLRDRILAQYPVAMIDEFQDTSPLQYRIFDRIYRTQANDPHSALILIGDPKQSIYGFRGADIYSYLQARRATTGRHYVLETNYRSTTAVVNVVNHWFAQADAMRSAGAFMYRNGADNPLPFVSVRAQGRKEILCSSAGEVPAMTLVHDLRITGNDGMRRQFGARCAEQIASWLNDSAAGFAQHGEPFRRLRPADIAILVRTGKEADAVRRELARRSIASVYLSDKDSVFASPEAHDLLRWLRAVAFPQDVRLVRAGFATGTVGLSLDEIGWLASNDAALDARSAQLRQLQGIWQTQGVLAMLRQSLHQLGLAARWLQSLNGERKLTNFLHLAELLQTASGGLDGEQALIRWLQSQVADVGAQGDEQVVRLESDADLVKVVTIYKSKGLEYSVVCLPYAASFLKKDPKRTTFVNLADEQGQRTLQLKVDADALARAERERQREDLRLLYVALTRARHALWVGFSALKYGNSSNCVSHESGIGYLLGGSEQMAAEDWLGPLTELATGNRHIVLQAAQEDCACTALNQTSSAATLQEPPDYQATFERHWKIGSFSQLTRDLASPTGPAVDAGSGMTVLQMPRPADDEPDSAPSDAVPALPPAADKPAGAADWHLFPKGAEAGNFLHEQLEWLSREGFALAGDDSMAQRLRRRCERAGRDKHADTVVGWLSAVVQTPLNGPDVALQDLDAVLPEMEFWLPAERIDAQALDLHCRHHLLPGVERPALADRQLHGMLMGFADLVFQHQGRYWVLDYKSNYLGEQHAAYSADALAQAMAQHRYDVQAAIYMLALHRLLQQRLGADYDAAQHLGGAVYLFLRGIQGPQNGVCLLPASLPLMDALAAMLDHDGAST